MTIAFREVASSVWCRTGTDEEVTEGRRFRVGGGISNPGFMDMICSNRSKRRISIAFCLASIVSGVVALAFILREGSLIGRKIAMITTPVALGMGILIRLSQKKDCQVWLKIKPIADLDTNLRLTSQDAQNMEEHRLITGDLYVSEDGRITSLGVEDRSRHIRHVYSSDQPFDNKTMIETIQGEYNKYKATISYEVDSNGREKHNDDLIYHYRFYQWYSTIG